METKIKSQDAFDILDDDRRSGEIIGRTLEFLRETLAPKRPNFTAAEEDAHQS